MTIHRHTIRLTAGEFFYLDTESRGAVILCLHGRWGRGETWVDFMRHYGGRYRVIAPDQRGHGLSAKPVGKYTADEMALDMVELLKALHVESAIVVGHSMGGRIAGSLAARHQGVATAVAILDKSAAGPGETSTLPLEQVPAIDPVTKDWPLPFASRAEAQACIRANTGSDLEFDYFMNSLVEAADGYRMMFSAQAIAANIHYEQGWFHLLPTIACPVLLIRAKGGSAVSDEDWQRMQSLLHHGQAHEVDTPDHNVHLADRPAFYAIVDRFLDGLARPGKEMIGTPTERSRQ